LDLHQEEKPDLAGEENLSGPHTSPVIRAWALALNL